MWQEKENPGFQFQCLRPLHRLEDWSCVGTTHTQEKLSLVGMCLRGVLQVLLVTPFQGTLKPEYFVWYRMDKVYHATQASGNT